MPRIAVARREAPLGLTIRTPRKSSNARRFHSPLPVSCAAPPRFSTAIEASLAMIYYNKVWAPANPFRG